MPKCDIASSPAAKFLSPIVFTMDIMVASLMSRAKYSVEIYLTIYRGANRKSMAVCSYVRFLPHFYFRFRGKWPSGPYADRSTYNTNTVGTGHA